MVTKRQKRDMDFCTACPKLCRHACPVGNAECRETVSPWGKNTMLNMVVEGIRPATADNCSVFYKCLDCLLCNSYCELDVSVPESLTEGRAIACRDGVAPGQIGELREKFAASGNPTGKDVVQGLKQLLGDARFEPGANAVLFSGCMHTTRSPGLIKKLFEVFGALGIDYVGAWEGTPYCCGMPLYTAGLKDKFLEHSARVAAALSRYKLIVTPCPACTYALKNLYPEAGRSVPPKIMHTSEFLLEPLRKAAKKKNLGGRRLAYHDPCYLGRYMEIYDQPREILAACGVDVAEFQWNKKHGYCCGAGGNLPMTSRSTAHAIADKRREQFAVTGADGIVTACPSCEVMLKKEGADTAVTDIVDIVHEALLG
jgi:Fe-S oxidoreductase